MLKFYNYAIKKPLLLKAMLIIYRLSVPVFSAVYITAGLYLYFQKASFLPYYITVPACVLIINIALRRIIKRPRPCAKYGLETPFSYKESFSCPSNHALCAMIIALACMQINACAGFVVLLLALATGVSRIFLGIHHISDIVLGYLLGGTAALVGFVIIPLLF